MAPIKRRRIEEDEVIAVESASSNLRTDARKKARLSIISKPASARPRTDNSEADSSEESDVEVLPDAHYDVSIPATQYETLRDGDWEHVAHEEEDDARATQAFEKNLRRRKVHGDGRIGDNHAAENAIIEEITCLNFMCHERLNVKLGPLINFVVGQNGSGKSAVLTAISLCLGGKVSATNRGTSLKGMIREGYESGALIVKLKNGGSDGYQRDLYGHSIIIERHFSKTGSSGFKLKSATGRLISNKKGDLDDIIEYYQLQVDNPMNILTQDAAKSFIQSSTPAQKYKFFNEGVQLQQLDNDYKLIAQICDQIEAKIHDANDDIQVLKKKRDVAHEKVEFVNKHDGMRKDLRRLRNQMAWVQVEDVERDLTRRTTVVSDIQGSIDEAERLSEQRGVEYASLHERMEHAQTSLTQVREEAGSLQEEEETAKSANDEVTKDVQAAHTQLRGINDSLKTARKIAGDCQEAVDQEKRRIEDANGGAGNRKLEEIEEAKQNVEDRRKEVQDSASEIPRLDEELKSAKKALADMDAPFARKKDEVNQTRAKLTALNSDRGNAMAGYDKNMPKLLKTIRNDRGFAETPIGPIGMHMKLRDGKQQWSNFLESNLGNVLNGFVVTSKPDQNRLSNILRSCHMDRFCHIFIGNHHPINLDGHEPDPQYDTILRILEFDNELVQRQLIINASIEQVLLVEDDGRAHSIMFDGAKLRNVKACFAPHPSKRNYMVRLAYSGGGGFETGTHNFSKAIGNMPRITTDVAAQITMVQADLKTLENEKSALETNQRQLKQGVLKCEQAIARHLRSNSSLKARLQEAEKLVEDLEAEYARTNIEDGVLDEHVKDLQKSQRDVDMYEQMYGNQGLEKEKLNALAIVKKKELMAVRERIADWEQKSKKAEIKLKNATNARQLAVTAKNAVIEELESLRRKKSAAEEKVQHAEARVQTFIEGASAICERVPIDNGQTAEKIDALMHKLSKQLESYQRQVGGSDQQIFDAFEAAESMYLTVQRNVQEMQALLQLLKKSFMLRIQMYRRFQQLISARSRINFNYLLSERAFRGKLSIDHKRKLLDVHVEPDDTLKNGKGRQTNTLSGGEKSFSSICLLLSLWEAMGAPLRCLDEYDVFMDDVNRDVSSKMIISAARRSVGRQFILITPKALGAGVEIGEDVKIHKLKDPREKGQQAIDEM